MLEKPSKSKMVEWAESYFKATSWQYPQEAREKIHQQYIKDILDKYDHIQKMSQEQYETMVQRDDITATIRNNLIMAQAENIIKGNPTGTTGFSKDKDSIDKLDRGGK